MSAITDFRAALKALLVAAWPELFGDEHPILWVSQANRRAWRSLVENGQMAVPWVVVDIPPLQEVGGFGACNEVYSPTITVFYITDMAAARQAAFTDVSEFVQTKLDALAAALKAHDGTGFQFWWNLRHDVSDLNPANAVFLSSNIPMYAGSLSFQVIFGSVERDN